MRILVTGATGSVGVPLLKRITEAGHHAIAYARRPLEKAQDISVHTGDIRDASNLERVFAQHQPDVVVHLAALLQFACEEDPRTAIDINVTGTLNVLEACRRHGVSRIVFGGSIASYGQRSDVMREDDPPSVNISLYGETKRLGEVLGGRYQALYGIEFMSLRYSGIFGPGAAASRGLALARHLVKSAAHEKRVIVPDVSGEETTHLTYVKDAVEATLAIALRAEPLPHAIYNVAGPDGNHMSLRDFHSALRRVVPEAGEVIFTGSRARSSGPVDTSRLRTDLGFVPVYGVDAALREELSSF